MDKITLLPAIARMLCDTYSTSTTAQFPIRITHLQGLFWHASGRCCQDGKDDGNALD